MAAAPRHDHQDWPVEIQANHLTEVGQRSPLQPASREVVYALFRRADAVDVDPAAAGMTNVSEEVVNLGPKSVEPDVPHTVESHAASCVSPICPIARSTASAAMRQRSGVSSARLFFLSMPWIAENHKKEGGVSLSAAGQHCCRLRKMSHTRHCAMRRTIDERKVRRRGNWLCFVKPCLVFLGEQQIQCDAAAKAVHFAHFPDDDRPLHKTTT